MNDLQGARWIASDPSAVSPVFYKEFKVTKVISAHLFITGLGFFEARLNGLPVSEDRFVPVFSDYAPRDLSAFTYPLSDQTTHRIYYCHYDVTALLKEGDNLLTVQLGSGYYRQKERTCEGPTDFGDTLKTVFRLVVTTPTGIMEILSDGTEQWKGSEISYSNLFIGEVTDPRFARRQSFHPVTVADDPQAALCLQTCPPDRIIRTIQPRLMHRCQNRAVYDAGENISGVVRVKSAAPAGSRISLRFAENIREDHTLDFASAGSYYVCSSGRRQIQEDLFITDGSDRCYEPKFVWHAFRYFEIEGDTSQVEVLVIHSDTPVVSTFSSSSEGLNFLYDAFLRTQTNNMHAGVPSDCPHRERLGYTGDGQVCAPASMLTLDCDAFYRKWVQDILDCQDQTTGHVQHTAPLMGGGGGPGGWGCAVVLVPWYFYQRYGDRELLNQCFSPMQRWISYLLSHREDGLVVREEEKGWCLGDWCTLEATQIPVPFVNTCYLLKCLQIMQSIAQFLNRQAEIAGYPLLEKQTADALRRHFEKDGSWCQSIQGADAWALWVGLGDQDTASAIARHYETTGCFDTGFLGTDILLEVLFQYGYSDTALSLLESTKPGSFLYMKQNGATTIWERWTGEESHNHPMFGAGVRHLFTGLLGIRYAAATPGKVLISPQVPQKLCRAEGSLPLLQGHIAVSWQQSMEDVSFRICVPEGAQAHFVYGSVNRVLPSGQHAIVCRKTC